MGFFDAFAFLGGVIVYPIAGFSITYFGWRSAFIIPPILLALWTIVFAIVVKSSPEHAGLTVEWKEQEGGADRVTLRDYGMVLKNPVINMICFVAICSQFVRWGLVNWIIKTLTESKDLGGLRFNAASSRGYCIFYALGRSFFLYCNGLYF